MADGGTPQFPPGTMFKNTYRVTKKLGEEGFFENVYLMEDASNGDKYVMKVEGCREQMKTLTMEVVVLRRLKARGAKHACDIIDRGRNDQFHYVLMTLVGKRLLDLRREGQDQHLSLSSALRIGKQCLEAIADLHGIGFLHRDIQPSNFRVGRQEVNQHRNVFLTGFSFAHDRLTKDMRRTAGASPWLTSNHALRCASLNAHRNTQVFGRKDDLESWFYTLVELTVGRLPWTTKGCGDINEIGRLKETSRQDGSLFADCPPQYPQMLRYIDDLQPSDKPDYDQLHQLIDLACQANGFNDGDPYDWEKPAADAS